MPARMDGTSMLPARTGTTVNDSMSRRSRSRSVSSHRSASASSTSASRSSSASSSRSSSPSSASTSSSSSSSSSDSDDDWFDWQSQPSATDTGLPHPEPAPLPPPFPHHLHLSTSYVSNYDAARIHRKLNAIKLKHRSSLTLDDWQRYAFAENFPQWRGQCYASIVKARVSDRACGSAVRFPFRPSYSPRLLASNESDCHTRTSASNDSNSAQCECHASSSSMSSLRLSTVAVTALTQAERAFASLTTTPACFASVSASVDRIHERELSVESFIATYEQPYIPLLIDGLTADWPARHWTFASFNASPYRDVPLKCGEDDDGYSCKVKLKYFLAYMTVQRDDSPLYVFDCSFDDDPLGRGILSEFTVPRYFRDDLFSLVGEDRRPPYRWLCIGPQRSGSSLHIDPLATAAWNTLLVGMKLWVLFPPHCDKAVVKGERLRERGEDSEAITYFSRILPRIRAWDRQRVLSGEASALLGMREVIQYPGQTIFVPSGWHHAVLNLEDSIAITQNFCGTVQFPHVWRKTRSGRKKMARRWLRALYQSAQFNHLATLAVLLNEEDGFEWDDHPYRSNVANRANHGDKKRKTQSETSKTERSGSERRGSGEGGSAMLSSGSHSGSGTGGTAGTKRKKPSH